jgi:signal transduction histidine kinase/ActR/RegA family two-component response regulator
MTRPNSDWAVAIGASLVVLLLAVSSAWDLWRARSFTVADNDRELASLASAIAEHTARSMQGAQLILRRTAIDENVAHAQSAPRNAAEFLRKQMEGAPQLRELSIADASGQLIASTARGDYTHVNVSARPYFQQLLHASGDAMASGEPIVSFLDSRRTLPIAMRLHDANDRFTGAIVASLEDGYFMNFYQLIDLTPGTRIRLLSGDGEPITGYARAPQIVASDSRSVVRAVAGYPLKIEISRANRTILSAWYRTVFNVLMRTALISLFIALLAVFLIKQMRRVQRMNEQLRQSQKLEALGTFAGGVAHDFNNILGAILGFGERALSVLGEGTAARRYVEQVMKAGERARLLVERILTFSRSSMTARVPVDVRPVVDEALSLLTATLPAGIAVEVRLDGENLFVLGDPTHLHQVVMNLCSNAVHAMPHGGVLSVGLRRLRFAVPRTLSHGIANQGDYLQLEVADSGVGIAADVLERMFNPFFTTRRAGEGTGLGLSLVDGIVRDYGGAIDVQTSTGKGTRFAVYLPLTDALPVSAASAGGTLPHGAGQVVLLVDDEESLVQLEEEVLAELGYEPIGFASAEQAWAAFQQEPERFDAVITDQTMPDLTGLALLERIRALRPELPAILCSGVSNAALENAARAARVSAVLRKPLRQAELAAALERVFRRISAD